MLRDRKRFKKLILVCHYIVNKLRNREKMVGVTVLAVTCFKII